MKKIMMGAAVLALFATGCQNEVLVEQSQPQKGQMFTLEVGRGIESRTELSGTATHWSKDDAIYVSGKGGNVHGILKFVEYVEGNKAKAKFSGFIFGGDKNELQHIVFPVPQNGKIDMSKRNPAKLDAPMIGTIGSGAVQTLKNVGGLLTFTVDGGAGNKYGVVAETSGGENMTGGYYEFDAETGTLKYIPTDEIAPVQVLADGSVYIPVATTTESTAGGNDTEVSVNVEVVNLENEEAITSQDGITVTEGEIYGDDETNNLGFETVSEDVVDTEWYDSSKTEFEISTAKQLAGLAKIVNEGTDNFEDKTIKLMGDIDLGDDEWLPIGKSDKMFAGTFDGNGKTISNMTIEKEYAAFMAYTSENVTIENITFENVNINSTKHAAGVVCIAAKGLTLENIKVSGKITATSYAGGIVHNATDISIEDCENNANINASRAAGIASWVTSGANIKNVKNTGNITGTTGASGIAHGFAGSISNAINEGDVKSTGEEPAAGIAGVQNAASTYEYCFNYGDVTTTKDNPNSSAAGILGHTPGTEAKFSYCANYGNVIAEQSYAAGIGYSLYGTVVANYCYNAGAVTGADGAGAIAPKAQYGANDTANYCLNAGTITSSNGTVYQGSNKNNSCFYYDANGGLKDVTENEEKTADEALTILNGGEDTDFFELKDGKIYVK